MTHAPEDVEVMARLLCEGAGYRDPDMMTPHGNNPIWWSWRDHAIRTLDALQAKGWKITTPFIEPKTVSSTWALMHDAASICPREDKE